MSNKIKCPMCSGKKVFHIRTFFPGFKGDIVPHTVEKPCPICEGIGFLKIRTTIEKYM